MPDDSSDWVTVAGPKTNPAAKTSDGDWETLVGPSQSVMDPRPWPLRAGETALPYVTGAMGAGAGGTIGGPAGAGLGFGVGYSAGQLSNKGINEKLGYTKHTPVTEEGLRENLKENTKQGLIAEAAAPVVGAVAKGIVGGPARVAERAAAEVAAPAEVAASKAAFEQAHMDAAEAAAKAVSDARQAELTKGPLRAAAKEEAIQGELGKTPERSLAARTQAPVQGVDANGQPVTEPNPQYTKRQSSFWNSVYGPVNRSSKNLGAQFESLFKDHLTKSVDTTSLLLTLADEEQYAAEHVAGGYGRSVRKVFDEIDPNHYRFSSQARELMSVPAEEMPRKLGRPLNISNILAVRSQIGELMPGASGPDKAALSVLREKIDKVLTETGVPGAQELRSQYRGFKLQFGKDFYRGISNAGDPSEAIPTLMADPQRSRMLFGAMTAPEKAVTRNAFADHMLTMGPDGALKNMDQVRPDWAPALHDLGYTGDMANPQSWINLSKTIPADIDWLNHSPAAYQKLNDNTVKLMKSKQMEVWNQAADAGIDEANKIGGQTGKQIVDAIKNARTPEEKARIAIDAFSKMTPEGPQQAERIASLRGDLKQPASLASATVNRFVRYGMMMSVLGSTIAATGSSYGGRLAERGGIALALAGGAGLVMKAVKYGIQTNPERYLALTKALAKPGSDEFYRVVSNMAVKSVLGTEPDFSKGATPAKPTREPFPKVAFPAHEAPDTAFRKALFADRLKTDSIKASSGEMAGFKSSSYKNALIQGIKNAKTPEAAQQLAEQMYNRGLISADDVKSAVSAAKDLPIADELKRNSTASLLKNYKSANDGERDALDAEIERRFEDSPDSFKKKELAPYKHLVLKVLSDRDKHAESASSTP